MRKEACPGIDHLVAWFVQYLHSQLLCVIRMLCSDDLQIGY